MSRPWTGAEVLRARKRAAEGVSLEDIADALGRTRRAVWVKLHRMAGPPPPPPRPRMSHQLAAAREALAWELACARAERGQTPLYRPGELVW
jgi:hypothetical protein